MNFILLDKNLNQIHILDEYESLIWTDRYSEAGDFEIYTSVNERILDILKSNETLYLWNSMSDHLMMMDEYEIKSDFDSGSKIVISGPSVEKILDRRIVWDKTVFSGSLQDGIKKLVVENAISPKNKDRIIPRLSFEDTLDPKILELRCEYELSGSSLYSSIKTLCDNSHIGFKIYLRDDDTFVMTLYSGVDRSYSQFVNPYVIFSPDFDNLGSSNYINSTKDYRNVIAIPERSSGDSLALTHSEYNPNGISGLSRRELVAESNYEEGSYNDELGKKDLNNHKHSVMIEGNIESSNMYIYGKDFFIGDIVQIRNEYGFESKSRVTELVMNQNQDDFQIYPTFTSMDKEVT